MNEKYEIIIKYNGEEIKRVGVKGFLLTAMEEDGIYKSVMGHEISGLEIALLTIANEELVDEMWEGSGITRKEREQGCMLARMLKMAVGKGDEE